MARLALIALAAACGGAARDLSLIGARLGDDGFYSLTITGSPASPTRAAARCR